MTKGGEGSPTVRWWKWLNRLVFGASLHVTVFSATRDRLFSESAARALKQFPEFCVVLVSIPQLRGPDFLEQFRNAWLRNQIRPVAGQLLRWPMVE